MSLRSPKFKIAFIACVLGMFLLLPVLLTIANQNDEQADQHTAAISKLSYDPKDFSEGGQTPPFFDPDIDGHTLNRNFPSLAEGGKGGSGNGNTGPGNGNQANSGNNGTQANSGNNGTQANSGTQGNSGNGTQGTGSGSATGTGVASGTGTATQASGTSS
ncbi:MAG TPA: hypothetical protein VD913_04185, partial [bacterium]|nr:hypothetical protein [bacterium]